MKRILVSIVILLQVLGCQNKNNPERQSVMLRAQKLIDSNHAEDAIVLLSDYYIKNPENREVRLILASAHAKMAGLTIDAYYDALYEKVFSKPLGKQNPNGGRSDEPLNEGFATTTGKAAEAHKGLVAFSQILKTSLMLSRVFINLPSVPPSKVEHLETAIELIETTPKLSRGESLFAATLYIVYFKHLFFFDLIPNSTVIRDGKCYFDFSKANSSTKRIKRIFGLTLESIGQAYPSQKSGLVKLRDDFFSATDALSVNVKDIEFVDSLLDMFAEDRLLEGELGRMFLCES